MAISDIKQPHILIVDDDVAMRNLLQRYLMQNDYAVTTVADGVMMDQALKQESPDLVILDLMLPGEDGLSLARRLRRRGNLPIIMLSARGEEVDRIVGLEIGADDYLAKPFNPRELLARIRSVLRRSVMPSESSENDSSTVCFGRYLLDRSSRQLFHDDKPITLTSGDFELLEIFVTHPNKVLNRDTLLQLLKGYEHQPYDRSIDVRITRLRKKIEPDITHPVYIRTVWGEGYLFSPTADDSPT
jgi:two-component system phosphate regulon response regulator OmpR